MTILTKGFVLFKCSGYGHELQQVPIAFSSDSSELKNKISEFSKSKKFFDDVKDRIELYRHAYESAWKFEICPKSKADHEAVANAKNSKGYVRLLQERKREFTKKWLSSNPILLEFKSFVKFNSTIHHEPVIEEPNADIWYTVEELEE